MEAIIRRRVLLYVVLNVVTILCGLGCRSEFVRLPVFVSTYAGDTFWGLMVFWCFCIVRPYWKTWKIGASAILFSFAIELSQLYHGQWIENIRHRRFGGLVLGYGFKFSDLVCYTAGIVLGVIIVELIVKFENDTKT